MGGGWWEWCVPESAPGRSDGGRSPHLAAAAGLPPRPPPPRPASPWTLLPPAGRGPAAQLGSRGGGGWEARGRCRLCHSLPWVPLFSFLFPQPESVGIVGTGCAECHVQRLARQDFVTPFWWADRGRHPRTTLFQMRGSERECLGVFRSPTSHPPPPASPAPFLFIPMARAGCLVKHRHSPPLLVVSTLGVSQRMEAGRTRIVSCSLLHPSAWGAGARKGPPSGRQPIHLIEHRECLPCAQRGTRHGVSLSKREPWRKCRPILPAHPLRVPILVITRVCAPFHSRASRLGRGDQQPSNTSSLLLLCSPCNNVA